MKEDRLFPKLTVAVVPVPSDDYAARPILDRKQGQEHARRAVLDGVLKPSDIDSARVDQVKLLFAPFWRVDVSVDGCHVDLGRITIGSGGTRIPLPTGGSRHKEAVVMVSARKNFPYEPRLPSWMNGKLDGIAPLEVSLAEIVSCEQMPRDEIESGELVEADVMKEDAQGLASRMVLRVARPQSALISNYEPTVKSAIFCRYPVYYARYEYSGAARRSAGEEFFVCVSARTGKAVSAHHPSLVRAAAEKFRKLLTFGR